VQYGHIKDDKTIFGYEYGGKKNCKYYFVEIALMEVSDFCYYIVPAALGVFGLGMTIFLSKSMSNEPGRMERELQGLTAEAKTEP